jgi:hypothetical protein
MDGLMDALMDASDHEWQQATLEKLLLLRPHHKRQQWLGRH